MHPRRTVAQSYRPYIRTATPPRNRAIAPTIHPHRRAIAQSRRPYIRTAAPTRNRTDHTFAPPRHLCSYADHPQTNRPHSLLHMSNCSYVQYIISPPLCQEENGFFYIKTLFQPPLARLTAPHPTANSDPQQKTNANDDSKPTLIIEAPTPTEMRAYTMPHRHDKLGFIELSSLTKRLPLEGRLPTKSGGEV